MAEKTYCVYKHTNTVNGMVYIGMTGRKPNERWRNGEGYRHNEHFMRAIEKYGWGNFKHEVLWSGSNREDAERKVETGVVYPSIIDAFEQTGVDRAGICLCCNGKRKTSGGYRWEFVS